MPIINPHAALLRWLSLDEREASHHYQCLRQRLMGLLARNGAPSSMIEELADITLERAGQKLAEGTVIRHPEPMAYLHGVAINVLREYRRKTSREISMDDLPVTHVARIETRSHEESRQQELEIWLECLENFLEKLPPEEESLIRACYHDDPRQQAANRRSAAKRLNVAESSLRASLYRIRQTLERKVRSCVETRQK
mgnify:CR=1 FL=1